MTKPEASTQYSAVRFGYTMNDRTLTHVVGETWEWDENPLHCPTNYAVTWAREFRYDGARARYLNRELDPVALEAGNFVSLGDTWTDYDGDSAYGDFSVDASLGTIVGNKQSFEPGLGRFEWSSTTTELNGSYYHTDHLGTIRGVTDFIARWGEAMTFTAFGERIVGTQNSMSTRFGYVGSFGYESTPIFETNPDTALPFLHVGARYYDPATGRFLQRDPIGIRGGLNLYAYVRNGPTIRIDPDGLFEVGACVGYCKGRLGGCIGAAGGNPGKIGKCEAKYKACETCCGNADIDSQQGDDKGPPPYGPPPATFDPWPAGGSRWRAIAILLLCFVSLWGKRAQPALRVSK